MEKSLWGERHGLGYSNDTGDVEYRMNKYFFYRYLPTEIRIKVEAKLLS